MTNAAAPPPAHRLRVALLLDSYTLPTWVCNVVRDITTSEFARVSLVILNVGQNPDVAPPTHGLRERVRRWIQNRDLLPFALYDRIDRRKFGKSLPDPFEPCDAEPLIRGCPVVRVSPRMTKFSDYFDDATVEEILAHDVDVALRFGFRILRGRALHIARYGVWSYHHGDNEVNRGGPAGYWEVFENQPVTGAMLQVLSEDLDGGQVLARTFASTIPISATKNRANYFWQTIPMVGRKLRDLYYDGPSALHDESLNPPTWRAYSNPLYAMPRAAEMWPAMRRLAVRYVREKLQVMRYHDQWFIAYRLNRPSGAAAPVAGGVNGDVPDGTMFRARNLVPPRELSWADPFPVYDGERCYLFFEEYTIGNGHGRILVTEIDARGNAGPPVPALECDYHLSYPFVFKHEGTWYMMPETGSTGSVQLFRATRFPVEWEFDRTLVEIASPVDPTIAEIDGQWWMFVGTRVPQAVEWTELCLFRAPSPLGPWQAHPRNPVKTDARSARPGGRIFNYRGAYYRPAQDGTPRYGSATVVHRIERIDCTTYREVPVARIEPRWMPGLTGTHTLNAAAGLTAVDVRRLQPR